MNTIQASSCKNNLEQILITNVCEPTHFKNNHQCVRIPEALQSLRKSEVLCDVIFNTNDGKYVMGHKIVLMAGSSYFRKMFSKSNMKKSNESDAVSIDIKELDYTTLELLVDYIYTGEIMVTKENVQALLLAANVLQLDYVSSACTEFLKKQLNASNCVGIKAFADSHNCTELLLSSEAYIKKQFLEVVKSDEFLSLSFNDVKKIISYNDLAVPNEVNVYESVIKWVKNDLVSRKKCLPKLMEHVRLPLLKPDILCNISEEPLLSNSSKCKDYIIEAFCFNHKKSVQHFTIPRAIRCKPRQIDGSQKVILMFNESDTSPKFCTEWYDPATRLKEENAPGINDCCREAGFGIINDQCVYVMGGVNKKSSKSVMMLDVSSYSPSWVPMANMLVNRCQLGVGVLDNSIYAVGGFDDNKGFLNSVEVFDVSNQKWRMVTSMSTKRCRLGVGVLKKILYAVGGCNASFLKSVEYYDLQNDKWIPVADMSVCRDGVGVGVLDDLMYAIGGHNGRGYLKSVEVYRPSDGVWYSKADMHLSCYCPRVVALNGLLYVMGGETKDSIVNTVEIYDPKTNTWTLERFSSNGVRIYGGVVVDRPHHHH